MALAAAAAACGGELVTERILAPDPVRCRIQLSQPPGTALPAEGTVLTLGVTADRDCAWQAALGSSRTRIDNPGGSFSVRVSAGAGCEWRASSPVGWVTVSPTADMGAKDVRIDVAANSGGDRSATLSIADQPFEVTQGPPAPPVPVCTFAISPSSASISFKVVPSD